MENCPQGCPCAGYDCGELPDTTTTTTTKPTTVSTDAPATDEPTTTTTKDSTVTTTTEASTEEPTTTTIVTTTSTEIIDPSVLILFTGTSPMYQKIDTEGTIIPMSFEFGTETEVKGSCSATYLGQMYIFGGATETKQISVS